MKDKYWKPQPEFHDYPAAYDYLSLIFTDQKSQGIVSALESSETITKKAKDILRASKLDLLSKNNSHVEEVLSKIKKGKKLSPILLVRGEKLIIADGYHRLCAIYYLSEDTEVLCRIVD